MELRPAHRILRSGPQRSNLRRGLHAGDGDPGETGGGVPGPRAPHHLLRPPGARYHGLLHHGVCSGMGIHGRTWIAVGTLVVDFLL